MKSIQYTIRGIPKDIDTMIRKRAKREGKSFNATVLEIIQVQVLGSAAGRGAREQSIFDKMHGANTFDDKFFEAVAAQSEVDSKLWQ